MLAQEEPAPARSGHPANKAELSRVKNLASHTRLIFGLIISAVFLDVVDFSIIQVALPSIRTQWLVSLADSQWIVGAYGITMAGCLLLSGRAGDIYGQKKLFIFGIALFTVASITGGFAPSLLFLVISRAIQGVGAAVSSVTAFAIFIELFPEGKERNRALGIFIAVLSAGFAAGSVAGGVLTVEFGWRSVMFVNVPIGIVAAVLSQKYLPNAAGRLIDGHLDLPGALTVTAGILLLVYGLTNAADSFSSLDTIIPLALSIAALSGFAVIESRSKAPLMPLSFLRRGTVLTANVLSLILGATVAGLSFIITIYLQQVLGYSALQAGAGFLPGAIIFFVIGGWGASRLVNRYGIRRVLVVSAALIAIGCAGLVGISPTGNYFGVLPGMILWALGASIGFPAINVAAIAGTKPGEEGLASGLITTSTRLGFPLGLAILLTVAGATDPAPSSTAGPSASAAAVVGGFQWAIGVAALLGVLGVFVALRVKEPGFGPGFAPGP
jgi:EmrB/QacA subfamily drug resistance transporter